MSMEKGFGYLVTIMDWHSRKVLSWRLSNTLNTLGADFCVQVLEAAIRDHGYPQIFNTDQDAQFTSEALSNLKEIRQNLTQWFAGTINSVFIKVLITRHRMKFIIQYTTIYQAAWA